jgi:Tfp pilus assembly protein PilO
MVFQVPVPPTPPTPPDISRIVITDGTPWATLPPQFILLIVVAAIALAGVVLWPLMRAIARRIEGGAGPDGRVQAELEQLRTRVGTLEAQQVHLAELEERLDFAERLLTQQRAQSPIISAGDQR